MTDFTSSGSKVNDSRRTRGDCDGYSQRASLSTYRSSRWEDEIREVFRGKIRRNAIKAKQIFPLCILLLSSYSPGLTTLQSFHLLHSSSCQSTLSTWLHSHLLNHRLPLSLRSLLKNSNLATPLSFEDPQSTEISLLLTTILHQLLVPTIPLDRFTRLSSDQTESLNLLLRGKLR